ncbi:MAG: bacteroid development protein BacA [Devosia sp.]|uniref:peptide antibiotic transporter SbmA n=1 Tax=Devosia sp. TaxID=1871048 RepID=UPI00261D0603|nr:peptide antibiotic transporter SbmA [Devosia sp.]MDB5587605.1 bacteroid development protein BacA [Devosia sp.]
MFRSFFPAPKIFFTSAALWIALTMLIWFTLGSAIEPYLSLGPWLSIPVTEANPAPFFDSDKVWLYQYVIVAGYLFCVPWFFFNDNRRWYWWSVVGTVTIIEVVYFNVQVSAWLNDWYGSFYDLIQTALDPAKKGTVTLDQYFGQIATVAIVFAANVLVLVINAFLNAHYLLRWRRAMTFYYMANWPQVRTIEGAAQRVQEDTQNFSSIVEGLGLNIISSFMTLIVFLPILWNLSTHIIDIPIFGAVQGSLVWLALFQAIFGTVLFAVVGIRLPGLNFANQRVEAAFRKELVYGEDNGDRADPVTVRELFRNVQRNYFRIYFHYTYFNVARYAFINSSQFFPYLAMGPTVIAGALTFGLFQQILSAFGQVADSFSFLMNSWTTIINLISIYQRLRGFEKQIPPETKIFANDYDDPRFLDSRGIFVDPTPPSPAL